MSMFKKFGLTAVAAGIAAGSMVVSNDAEAVPAFARQTGMACTSCHVNFPALNAFGRSFKASGYTMRGAAPLVEGDGLSFPADLKASVISKVRYVMRSDDNTAGQVAWPDEAAMLVGGRAAENIGFLLELQLGAAPQEATGSLAAGPDGLFGTADDVVHTAGETNSYAGAKFHFNVTDNFAVIPFSTDGLGIGYSFELLNTGVARPQRAIENRRGYSATNMLGLDGAATGIALVYHTENMFVNYSHWAPAWGPEIPAETAVLGGLAHYLRAAYMPRVAGWDMGFGVALMSGGATINDGGQTAGVANADIEVLTNSTVVDFQALGELGGKPAEFYLTYGDKPKDNAGAGEVDHFGAATDETAIGGLFQYGFMPGKAAAHIGFMSYDVADDAATALVDESAAGYTSYTLGATYYFAQNVRLEAFHENKDGDHADTTTLQLTMGL